MVASGWRQIIYFIFISISSGLWSIVLRWILGVLLHTDDYALNKVSPPKTFLWSSCLLGKLKAIIILFHFVIVLKDP